jgi:hypothetical protein
MAEAEGISVFKVVDETVELINFTYLGVSASPANMTTEEAKGVTAFGNPGSELSVKRDDFTHVALATNEFQQDRCRAGQVAPAHHRRHQGRRCVVDHCTPRPLGALTLRQALPSEQSLGLCT